MDNKRKNSIIKRLKNCNFRKESELLLKLIELTHPNVNKYDYYNKNKGNYNKKISGEREFNEKEIYYLEKILSCPFSNLIDDTYDYFYPQGIRYAVFKNDYDELMKEVDGFPLISKYDEFDKTIFDYIIEFKSVDLLEQLMSKGKIYFSNGLLNTSPENLFIKEDLNNNLFSLVLDFKNYENIDRFYNYYEIIKMNSQNLEKFINKEFANKIVSNHYLLFYLINNSPKHLNLLNIDGYCLEIEESLFVNPIISYILRKHLDLFLNKQSLLIEILTKIKQINTSLLAKYKSKGVRLNKEGYFVDEYNIKYGSCYVLEISKPFDFDTKTMQEIEGFDNSINNFVFDDKDLTGGFTSKTTRVSDGKLIKMSSHNYIEYEFLNICEKEQYNKVPKYIETKDDLDYFTYISGYTKKFVYECKKEEISQIVKELKNISDLSKKHFKNKFIVHGDLSPMNVVFEDNKLTGIIDWDSCSFGDEYYDFIYVFWTWANVGSKNRNNEKLFETLKFMLNEYGADKDFKSNFYNKIIDVMETKLTDTDKNSPDYQRIFEWVKWSEIRVDLYKERIEKEIG